MKICSALFAASLVLFPFLCAQDAPAPARTDDLGERCEPPSAHHFQGPSVLNVDHTWQKMYHASGK